MSSIILEIFNTCTFSIITELKNNLVGFEASNLTGFYIIFSFWEIMTSNKNNGIRINIKHSKLNGKFITIRHVQKI